MEVLSADYGNQWHVTPERSPNQSPLSTSPSPEQSHSPRGSSHEQSLHVIVEPQLDGQTNFIHLMNPPTGHILSSFIAEHGAHIEIQPGVFFRVPFPHEHGYPSYPTGPPMQPQPQAYHSFPANIVPSHTHDTNFQNMVIPYQQYNPSCPIHGSPGNNNANLAQIGDERLDKCRKKLQKKLREKNDFNHNQCTCYKSHNGPVENFTMVKDPRLEEENIQAATASTVESYQDASSKTEEEVTICVTPKAKPLSPYAIILSWDECISNNSRLLLFRFELQMSNKGNNFRPIYSGTEKRFTTEELSPGTEYSFRLCALLKGKRGPFSEVASCTTPCTFPERPLPPRITQKTKSSLTLKWTVPLDGGSPITYYKLQWSKGQQGDSHFDDLYVGLQKQYKHNHKLPPGTPCMFRLQAGNNYGESEFSQILECLTSAGPPSVPAKPEQIEFGTNFIKLRWTEPENNGSPVNEYKLEMEDPADGYGFIVQYCGGHASYCCQNLRRNTPYKFRLLAANNLGCSKSSIPVIYSTLPETPGKMDKPKVNGKLKTHTIPVKWDPPTDTGGEQIIGYILEVDDGKGGAFTKVYHGSDQEYIADQLKPGHTYRFRVASESKAGIGVWSPIANMTTLPVCPRDSLPPRISSTLKPEMTTLYLEWDAPLDQGGAPVTNYTVKMADSLQQEFKRIYVGLKRCFAVTDLQPGTDYFFKLQAANSAGASPWSSISILCTAPGPPNAPLPPLVLFKSPTHIRLDWTEPELHGTEVAGYCVEKLENETFQKVYQGNCLFCEIKRNIEPASQYYFRLQALSAAGSSSYSNICTVETPPAPPRPVSNIKVLEQTSNSCLIQWRHPVEHGSPVFEYVIEATGATSLICTVQRPKPSQNETNTSTESIKSDKKFVDVDSDDESDDGSDDEAVNSSCTGSETSSSVASRLLDDTMEYKLTGLTADAAYKLRLQAVNHVGAGPFSHSIQFFTKELPPSPPSLNSSSISYHSIKLKWGDATSSRKSLAVMNHTLQVQNKSGSFSSIYNGMGSSFTLSKLKELTPYCCRIRSKNDAGEGEFSKPKIFYTKAQTPSSIKDFKSKDVTESSVNLTWSPCEKIRNDDTINYVVQTLHQDYSKDFTEIYKGSQTKYAVKDLQPDQMYQFRVHAVRLLSDTARVSVPSVTEEIKGVFSPICRVRTLSELSMEDNEDGKPVDATEEESEQVRRLTDTHIALIILGSFLGICLVIAVVLKWVLGEY